MHSNEQIRRHSAERGLFYVLTVVRDAGSMQCGAVRCIVPAAARRFPKGNSCRTMITARSKPRAEGSLLYVPRGTKARGRTLGIDSGKRRQNYNASTYCWDGRLKGVDYGTVLLLPFGHLFVNGPVSATTFFTHKQRLVISHSPSAMLRRVMTELSLQLLPACGMQSQFRSLKCAAGRPQHWPLTTHAVFPGGRGVPCPFLPAWLIARRTLS